MHGGCRRGRRPWSAKCRSSSRRTRSSSRSCRRDACRPSSAATCTASASCACRGRRPACPCSPWVLPLLYHFAHVHPRGADQRSGKPTPCKVERGRVPIGKRRCERWCLYNTAQNWLARGVEPSSTSTSTPGCCATLSEVQSPTRGVCRRQRTQRCCHSSKQPRQARREMRRRCRTAGMSRKLCMLPK